MYAVYFLESLKTGGRYIGHCKNVHIRLKRHNAGLVRSTKSNRPWKIVRIEKYTTKAEAYARERKIKSYKGGRAFQELLNTT